MLGWLLRKAFIRMFPPKVSPEEALEIAQKFCKENGWSLYEPKIYEGLTVWRVIVFGNIINPSFVEVDKQTGKVRNSALVPR